jgi:hypothetical protein
MWASSLAIGLRGGETIIADKGYAGREFEQTVAERFGAQVLRPRRADESGNGPHLAPRGARGLARRGISHLDLARF